MLASSLKVPKMRHPKGLKINVFDYPSIVLCFLSGEPLRISAYNLYCQKLKSS